MAITATIETVGLPDGHVFSAAALEVQTVQGFAHCGGASQLEADNAIWGYWLMLVRDRNLDGKITPVDGVPAYELQAYYYGRTGLPAALGGEPSVLGSPNYAARGWDGGAENLLQNGDVWNLTPGAQYLAFVAVLSAGGSYSFGVSVSNQPYYERTNWFAEPTGTPWPDAAILLERLVGVAYYANGLVGIGQNGSAVMYPMVRLYDDAAVLLRCNLVTPPQKP
jgi:hypothetical protein